MKINFLKKNNVATGEISVREEEVSPYKDWLKIISIFSAIVLISALLSAFYFYRLLNSKEFEPNYTDPSSASSTKPHIDTALLQSAVDFIQVRSGIVSLTATTTN